METVAPPPLTQQVAGLAAGCRCESGRLAAQAGAVAALHALIFAALAGLLGRLESLMALLAAGQLPSHTACQTSVRHPAVPVPASPLRAAAPYPLESPARQHHAPQHLFPTATPSAARVTAHPAKIAPVVVRSRLGPNPRARSLVPAAASARASSRSMGNPNKIFQTTCSNARNSTPLSLQYRFIPHYSIRAAMEKGPGAWPLAGLGRAQPCFLATPTRQSP